MSQIFNRSDQKQKRRELRNNMPPAEVIIWSRLQRRQLHNYKFRRQFSVGPFVLDFYCTELKLAIELDGDSHFRDGGQAYDASRDEFIAQFGIRVLRVLNMEVFGNLDGVIEYLSREVLKRVAERSQPPVPPFS